ncbi:MAG: acyl-CoA dehydrogenase family protein [Ktedonobacterales bacterium]
MDFSLTDEQRMIQRTVRDFVTRELLPLEGEVLRREREGQVGITRAQLHELQLRAKDYGFWGINTPEEYGGVNLGPVMLALVMMELARTFIPFVFGGSADNILYYCNEEQKQRYLLPTIAGERISCFALTEPGAGSDAANIQMTAVQDGDHWVLNGEKTFITNGNDADFAMVFAVTDKVKGARGGITCFLVDREMGWQSSYIPTMGEWGPAGLSFADVRVPAYNVLGEVGQGFRLGMQWIGQGRWIYAARAVGAAERLLQMALDHANTRVTFGAPIGERQSIQWMIADSEVEIEAAKWLAFHAAWMAEQGQDTRHAAAIAKLHGTTMANRVVDRVMQIHGGMGYTRELPIERWYREMRVWRIFEGTDEIQHFIIARDLLRGYTKIGELL